LSEKYFGYAISVGVKLFTIYLIIGFGDSFTQALKDTIAAAYAAHPEGPSFGDYLGVGGASLFYGVTGYMAPGLAGSMLNGTVAMSLQSAGTAAGMVGGAPVAAALASSAAGARALGLAGGAIGALLPLQRAAGAIGGSSAGVGFAGGIGGAVSPVSPGSSVNPGSPGHPFWSASAPSKPGRASSASITSSTNSEGTSRATSMASSGSPDLSIAASPTRPSDGTRAPDAVPGSPGATPSSSERQREGPSMNASHASNASRPTMGQAPGFVDPRFDPSAMQGVAPSKARMKPAAPQLILLRHGLFNSALRPTTQPNPAVWPISSTAFRSGCNTQPIAGNRIGSMMAIWVTRQACAWGSTLEAAPWMRCTKRRTTSLPEVAISIRSKTI
jgi:hypothetical protein